MLLASMVRGKRLLLASMVRGKRLLLASMVRGKRLLTMKFEVPLIAKLARLH